VSPVRYELGSYIPEDGNLHSHYRENLKSYSLTYVICGGEASARRYTSSVCRREVHGYITKHRGSLSRQAAYGAL
jgi:hypothetical protein